MTTPRSIAAGALALLVVLAADGSAAAASRHRRHAVVFPPRAAAAWPSMRHDSRNTGAGTIPGVYRGDRPWSFRTGRGLFLTPVVGGDGAVYFGSADDTFYALSHNGRLRWRFTTGNIIDAAAAISPS